MLLVLALVAVALAVLKPWTWGNPPQPAVTLQGLASSPPASSSPASDSRQASGPAPSPATADQACYRVPSWRLFTVDRDGDRTILTWYSLNPLPGTAIAPRLGQGDPNVPSISVFAQQLLLLGYCPAVEGAPRRIASTEAWELAPHAAKIDLVPSATYGPLDPNAGQLFNPPSPLAHGVGTAWPAGRYVFVVRYGPAASDQYWFGATVQAAGHGPPAAAGPSPSPSSSASGR